MSAIYRFDAEAYLFDVERLHLRNDRLNGVIEVQHSPQAKRVDEFQARQIFQVNADPEARLPRQEVARIRRARRLRVHIFSDCESTVAAIIRINKGGDFQNIKRYEDRVDLLPRLRAVMAARRVQVTLYTGGSLDHQNCHRRARQRLREEIGLDARRQHHLALTRQRSRLTQLIKERGGLIHRLGKLDEEISIAQVTSKRCFC